MKKILLITLPALLVTSCVAVGGIELWVRMTWDPLRGRPGFFVSDAVRIEKLAANYDGWFAGVPVHINSLGFRDNREYALEKGARTFRILIIGDSVTFGHGSLYETTYPYLLEQRLTRWQPGVDWQVWNLGVPGYNTSQELATLLEVGPSYRPDLVIIGFFENDVVDNRVVRDVISRPSLVSDLKTWMRRHVYSADWYRRTYLTLKYRLFASPSERLELEGLAAQETLLARASDVALLAQQQLTNPQPMSEAEARGAVCPSAPRPEYGRTQFQRTPGFDRWKAAVEQLQQLNRQGTYRIVFFVNYAPRLCRDADLFDTRSSHLFNEYLLEILSNGTLAVSSYDAFARFRPSQMPLAAGHSIGNSNVVKASVLFEFLKDHALVTPPVRTLREAS